MFLPLNPFIYLSFWIHEAAITFYSLIISRGPIGVFHDDFMIDSPVIFKFIFVFMYLFFFQTQLLLKLWYFVTTLIYYQGMWLELFSSIGDTLYPVLRFNWLGSDGNMSLPRLCIMADKTIPLIETPNLSFVRMCCNQLSKLWWACSEHFLPWDLLVFLEIWGGLCAN
jgi:hypothetical protein